MADTEKFIVDQVNYVGPYMLTRLLEPCLRAAGHARVVNVSSVTHRYGVIGNPAAFLSSSNSTVGGQYPVRDPGFFSGNYNHSATSATCRHILLQPYNFMCRPPS